MDDVISRQKAIVTAVNAAINWHKLANPQYSIAYCIGEAMRQLSSAQPYTIHSDGRLWITVDDIDKVTAVVVDEHKSKFCKQFYEDYEDAQPDIIRCKDCKYWDTTWQNDYAPNYHYCPMIDGTRRNDFYCADAERRTDG